MKWIILIKTQFRNSSLTLLLLLPWPWKIQVKCDCTTEILLLPVCKYSGRHTPMTWYLPWASKLRITWFYKKAVVSRNSSYMWNHHFCKVSVVNLGIFSTVNHLYLWVPHPWIQLNIDQKYLGKCCGVGDVYNVVRRMIVVSVLSIHKLLFLVIISWTI